MLMSYAAQDLNYTYDPKAAFQPWTHALRMQEMGSVYVTTNCSHFQNPAVGRGINSTFGFWLWAQPSSQNWWFQAIGDALPVAQLTLQFGSWLSPVQAANASYLLSQSTWESWSKTGTNAVDIGKVRVTFGVITSNTTMVQEAFAVICASVVGRSHTIGGRSNSFRAKESAACNETPFLLRCRLNVSVR